MEVAEEDTGLLIQVVARLSTCIAQSTSLWAEEVGEEGGRWEAMIHLFNILSPLAGDAESVGSQPPPPPALPPGHYDSPKNSHVPGHYDLPPVRHPPSPPPRHQDR